MSKQASEFQEKSMSIIYRGKEIFKPLNTGRIDERVSCVREFVANIFFYTKNGVTIMIDAGYNYPRLKEKMGWLDLDPASVQHILITHQDTDHVGAVEADSDGLFREAKLYIGEVENRYLTGEVRRKVIFGLFKLPIVKTDNQRVLLQDGQVLDIEGIKIECFMVPGHTWGHMVYLIDNQYLFTGDTLWFGPDGGKSFINCWQRTTNWLSAPWRCWRKNCEGAACVPSSSPATPDGQTIWSSPLPTRTRSATHGAGRSHMTPPPPLTAMTNRMIPRTRPGVSAWKK